MLRSEAVDTRTLELLRSLSKQSILSDFFLVGGTALALKIGHRTSIDLDFFSTKSFQVNLLQDFLIDKYNFQIHYIGSNAITGTIDSVKIDLISHQYPILAEQEIVEGVKLSSTQDIAAMKINAICNRACKKDFVDLYFLLKQYSLQDILKFYQQKYRQDSLMMALKSLIYFNNADLEPDPNYLGQHIKWEDVKSKIIKESKILLLT